MNEPEYMLTPYKIFPPDIIAQYNLDTKVENGHVLAKIVKGMYGLPQAGRLAHDQLKDHLAKADYYATPITPGLFRHKTRPITVVLVVDNYGIKFESLSDLKHLVDHLKTKYKIVVCDGKKFCEINLDWNYAKRTTTLSIPKYIPQALIRQQHPLPSKPQYSPHFFVQPKYGKKLQMVTIAAAPQPFTKDQNKFVQQTVGIYQWFARIIDSNHATHHRNNIH